ncbi:MAG TPA: type II toxin-antitoxin system VapC family toxin [Candidatus Dormibacteraeota bacterium]|nr:type II toxin-antitoxin system VapC family toxin [Candidatus Dormibacteraeota bacterium]
MDFDLLVLDTNYYSALAKNNPRARSLVRNSEEVALPHTVIGELLGGFYYGSQFDKNYSDLKRVLAKPSCRILMPSMETAKIYGRLYAELKKSGKMIPTNDVWIAALTIEYEGTLASFDKDFTVIPDIKLIS